MSSLSTGAVISVKVVTAGKTYRTDLGCMVEHTRRTMVDPETGQRYPVDSVTLWCETPLKVKGLDVTQPVRTLKDTRPETILDRARRF